MLKTCQIKGYMNAVVVVVFVRFDNNQLSCIQGYNQFFIGLLGFTMFTANLCLITVIFFGTLKG